MVGGGRDSHRPARGAPGVMAAPDLVNLSALIDDAKCFALVRQHRWPEGVRCPACGSGTVVRDGFDDTQAHRQRYRCKACAGRFDDLTRSEEHTSELQSRQYLVCRLLLEKKKKTKTILLHSINLS